MSARQPGDEKSPHNIDAERALLGAVLVENRRLDEVRDITSDAFFRDAHRLSWQAIVSLDEAQSAMDFLTLCEELRRVGQLEACGGPSYIASLTDGVPASTNVRHYARIVLDCAKRRAIIQRAQVAMQRAYDGEETADAILDRTDAEFLELRQKTSNLTTVAEMAPRLWERLEHRAAHRGELTGCPTGFKGLDEMTLGWQPGSLVFIAARPSVGKTSLTVNSAVRSAELAKRVVIFSLEMSADEVHERILAQLSGVPLERIRSAVFGSLDWQALANAFEAMHKLRIHIDDTGRPTVHDIRNTCRRLVADGPIDLVVVDYIQMVRGQVARKSATRSEELGDIAYRLKALAKELRVPILVCSQLTRLEGKARPELSHLRESGDLEQVADVVIMLWREAGNMAGGVTELLIRKARNGPTGTVYATFDRDTTTFTHCERPEPVSGSQEAPGATTGEGEKPSPPRKRRAPQGHFYTQRR